MKIMGEKKIHFDFERLLSYLKYLRVRQKQQELHVVAGYLSYVTLMSLVPMIVVMFSVMTAFPIFTEFKVIIEDFVYSNFMPASGDAVQKYISSFVSNASKMSAVAISFLFLFALLLISAIDQSLNKIWKIKEKRKLVTAFPMYWMILTLGPVLVGSSIAISSYVVSLVNLGEYDVIGLSNIVLRLLPLLSSVAFFMLLYTSVPYKVIRPKHAAIGALVAAILFEVAKKGFALYVTQFPSYQTIYGALAGIPILFAWVYLSWLVVLFGALITATVEKFDFENENKDKELIPN